MSTFVGRFFRQLRHLRRAAQRAGVTTFALGAAGSNVNIADGVEIGSTSNVFIGSDVFIGRDCWLSAAAAKIRIGSQVMLAPEVAIITGDHTFRRPGVSMFDAHLKSPEDDQDVVIEDDVWVGMRAIILKGITVGRGSVIGAGAVVTHDVPPYSVVAGVPAKVVAHRFTDEEIATHEQALYGKRITAASPGYKDD